MPSFDPSSEIASSIAKRARSRRQLNDCRARSFSKMTRSVRVSTGGVVGANGALKTWSVFVLGTNRATDLHPAAAAPAELCGTRNAIRTPLEVHIRGKKYIYTCSNPMAFSLVVRRVYAESRTHSARVARGSVLQSYLDEHRVRSNLMNSRTTKAVKLSTEFLSDLRHRFRVIDPFTRIQAYARGHGAYTVQGATYDGRDLIVYERRQTRTATRRVWK